eukprot:scaffold116139_cov63-Phaeocystis_antarctica.AAC.1
MMQGGSQDLQGGLQEEMKTMLQMLHDQETKEFEAWTLDAGCGDEAASCCNETGDEAGCDEVTDEAASYDILWLQDNLG